MAATRKIRADMHEAQLSADLETYRQKALELGASQAKIIRAEEIPVDERVPMKCQIPRCFGYGAGAQCPPNTMKPSELRELLKKYEWAVFFIKDVPSGVIVRDRATIKERVDAYQQIYTIVWKWSQQPSTMVIISPSDLPPGPAGTLSAANFRIARR